MYSSDFEKLSGRLANALQCEPRHPNEILAAVEQRMASLNELFFSRIPILVEGPEDIAFFATWLNVSGVWEQFGAAGCHFINCNGKTSMSRPLAIAKELHIPCFIVFDGDAGDEREKEKHGRDNVCLLRLVGHTDENPFPGKHVFGEKAAGCGGTRLWMP